MPYSEVLIYVRGLKLENCAQKIGGRHLSSGLLLRLMVDTNRAEKNPHPAHCSSLELHYWASQQKVTFRAQKLFLRLSFISWRALWLVASLKEFTEAGCRTFFCLGLFVFFSERLRGLDEHTFSTLSYGRHNSQNICSAPTCHLENIEVISI